jgi:FlaG/FlaF family flagellin (archaellin)
MNGISDTDAVSPVVGVMLMLVVTIIIAAVVSGFAGGLAGDTKTAPAASIDVSFMQDDGGMGPAYVEWKMIFEHLSGDSIPTRDIEIITYYTLSNGTVLKHTQTPSSESTDLYGYGTFTRVPLLNDMSLGYSGDNPLKDFGNYTWKTGDVLSSGSDEGTSALLGFDIDDSEFEFESGKVVDIKILHVPSGKYIYSSEVVV